MDHVFLRGMHHQKVDGRSPPTAMISETVSTSTGGTAVHAVSYTHLDVYKRQLFYNALRHGMKYTDPGAAYYEERYRQRVLSNLQRRAKAFGYVLQAAAPQAVGVS